MTERRRLTLADFDSIGDGSELTQQAVAASNGRRRLTLADIGDAKEPKEEPFAEGSTLKILNPIGDNLDTGVKLGKKTAQFLAGAGKAYADVGNRVRQVAQRPGAQEDIDQAAVRDRPLMETTPAMLGNMLPTAVIGAPVANTAKAATLFGTALGGLTPTTSSEGVGTEVTNAMLGGIGGGVGQKVVGGLTNLVGKSANMLPYAAYSAMPAVVQRYITRHGLPKPPIPYADQGMGANHELLNSQGVRHSIGDIDPGSMWRSMEDSAEPLKLGRHPFLQGQQEDLKSMLETTRAGINKPVIDPATGQPLPDSFAMAQGLKEQYAANKLASSANFDNVTQLAAQPGVKPVAPTLTYTEAQKLMAQKPEFFAEMQDNQLWRKLMGVERDSGPQTSVIVQQNGQPFKKPQLLDFAEVRALRSALGSEYRDAEKPSRKRAYAMLMSALDKDIDAWGNDTGNRALNTAYGEARAFHKQNVIPYTDPLANPSKSPIFSNIVAKDKVDSELVPAGVFKANRGQLAQDFMDLSAPSGQQAGKNELINEIVGAGLNPETEIGLSNGMIRHSARYSAPGSAVFNPGEQAALNNSVDALKLTRRAAQLGFTPPKTGFRIAPWAAGTALMGGASVPLYYGLNATLGDQLSPSERVASAFVLAPLAAYAAARGAIGHSQSGFGKALHLAEPNLSNPVLGGIQRGIRSSGKGIGFGVEDKYRRGALGHRADEDAEN